MTKFNFLLALLLTVFTTKVFASRCYCSVDSVAVYKERFHITCEKINHGVNCAPYVLSGKAIRFFAFPFNTDNSDMGQALLTLATNNVTANQMFKAANSNKRYALQLWFDPLDTSGKNFGCQDRDCRVIQNLFHNNEMFQVR